MSSMEARYDLAEVIRQAIEQHSYEGDGGGTEYDYPEIADEVIGWMRHHANEPDGPPHEHTWTGAGGDFAACACGATARRHSGVWVITNPEGGAS